MAVNSTLDSFPQFPQLLSLEPNHERNEVKNDLSEIESSYILKMEGATEIVKIVNKNFLEQRLHIDICGIIRFILAEMAEKFQKPNSSQLSESDVGSESSSSGSDEMDVGSESSSSGSDEMDVGSESNFVDLSEFEPILNSIKSFVFKNKRLPASMLLTYFSKLSERINQGTLEKFARYFGYELITEKCYQVRSFDPFWLQKFLIKDLKPIENTDISLINFEETDLKNISEFLRTGNRIYPETVKYSCEYLLLFSKLSLPIIQEFAKLHGYSFSINEQNLLNIKEVLSKGSLDLISGSGPVIEKLFRVDQEGIDCESIFYYSQNKV